MFNHPFSLLQNQKYQGKPIILRKSLSPPGKVTKTPLHLTEPWYTETFIEQVNNSPPCITSPPKMILSNIQQKISYPSPPQIVMNSQPKVTTFSNSLGSSSHLVYQKQIINPFTIDIKANNQVRQNNFMAKEQEQNQQFIANFNSVQGSSPSSYFQSSDISPKTQDILRIPTRIVSDRINQPSSQSLDRPTANPQLNTSNSNITATFPFPNNQITNFSLNSSTPLSPPPPIIVSQTFNPPVQSTQTQNPIIKICQSSSTIQSPIVSSSSIQDLSKEDCLFCKYEKLGIQNSLGTKYGCNFQQGSSHYHDHAHHHSYYKSNEPSLVSIQPSVIVMKDYPQIVSSTSRSFSPPNMSLQKLSQVVSTSKMSLFHKPIDSKETRVSINPVIINRSGSTGARLSDTKSIPPPKITITPSSPQNQSNAITPISTVRNADSNMNKNSQPNQLQQKNQNNGDSNILVQQTYQINEPQTKYPLRQVFESQKSPKSIDSEKSLLSQQSPYFKDPTQSQSPLQLNVGVDSFKSQNSESILTQIHSQTQQINSHTNQVNINSPQPTNKVRSVKCNNNFNKSTNSLNKVNDYFKDTSQSNSSLLIQQLNKMVLDEGDYYNKKSSIISPAPITNQQQNEKDPFGSANFQKALIKSQHNRPNSISKNTFLEQNKTAFSEFSLGSQIGFNNNLKENSSSSTLKSPFLTANFIDQQQKNFFPNSSDQASVFEEERIKNIKTITPIQTSQILNASGLQIQNQIGLNQEQLNFYQYQNKKIQDQISSQNVIRNMRKNEIDQAQLQLQQLKSSNKNLKSASQAQQQEKSNESILLEENEQSQLDYSFNNSKYFNQDQLTKTMCILDEASKRIPNKQNEIQQIKINYPCTIDTIHEEDMISRRGTVNQIIDKANIITLQGMNEGLNFSLNDLSSNLSDKKGDGYLTPNSLTPETRRFDQDMTPLSDTSYTYNNQRSDDIFDNWESTIKKNPPNHNRENQINTNQRFTNAHEPKVLENLETASKTHKYQIASPSTIPFSQT